MLAGILFFRRKNDTPIRRGDWCDFRISEKDELAPRAGRPAGGPALTQFAVSKHTTEGWPSRLGSDAARSLFRGG
jgi:hypothetical protein